MPFMFNNPLSLPWKKVACLTVPAIFLLSTLADAEDYLPFYRFYNTKIHQHEYTNSETEAEQWRKDPNKNAEGVLGWLPTKPGKDVTRLYRPRKATGRHYYYTVKPRGFKNFTLEPTVMYVYERKGTGRVGIHGTCLSGGEDMFFTKSKDEVKQVIEDTKKGIGNKRRKFYNAFYILEKNPEKKASSGDSEKKKPPQ
jgi:hypothetical protein